MFYNFCHFIACLGRVYLLKKIIICFEMFLLWFVQNSKCLLVRFLFR